MKIKLVRTEAKLMKNVSNKTYLMGAQLAPHLSQANHFDLPHRHLPVMKLKLLLSFQNATSNNRIHG
jgi:hypothetical protein